MCPKSFGQPSNLQQHIKSVHENVKNHACTQCSRTFSLKANLKRHYIEVHEKLKAYKCIECNSSFARLREMNTHYNKVHWKTNPLLKPKTEDTGNPVEIKPESNHNG